MIKNTLTYSNCYLIQFLQSLSTTSYPLYYLNQHQVKNALTYPSFGPDVMRPKDGKQYPPM